jgi:UDP-N-acetylglucosamine--N-acetylmuramyl-(pentapeptide) pyrophosphoryl-undecaprenol N-acetylglucosamine transferase
MDLSNKNIIITAGGTGGHIYPAMAVADLLAENGATVTWVGTPNSMEAKLVPERFNMKYIKSSGIRGKGLVRKLLFPAKLAVSTFKARAIIDEIKADMVIGFGGYVSGPICLAAKLKKVPVIIHEQNAKIGLTNRVLAKLANKICFAFEIDNIRKYLNANQLAKSKVVGNPVRKDIVALNHNDKVFNEGKLNLLVLGGSLGAKAINDIIPELIKKASETNIEIKCRHQTGQLSFEMTKEKYDGVAKENVKEVSPFIFNIAEAYEWADIVICRAGALTVSETAVAGVPAIFVPFPFAVDNHQFYNAQTLVKNEAGFCLKQEEMTLDNLMAIIEPLATDVTKLKQLSDNAKKALKNDASEQILECVKEVLL